jgi:hypothetical protein
VPWRLDTFAKGFGAQRWLKKSLLCCFEVKNKEKTFVPWRLRGKKKPPNLRKEVLKIWRRHTFPGVTQVSSALMGLTTLFGMGRGGHHR